MSTAVLIAQTLIALGILNVWLIRFGKATPYRGGKASNMKEEFAAYGLPLGSVYVIGGLKLLLAAALIAAIWVPELRQPAAIGMAVLMLGAVSMHVRVKDDPMKAVPAALMLALSVFVALAG